MQFCHVMEQLYRERRHFLPVQDLDFLDRITAEGLGRWMMTIRPLSRGA